MRFRFVFVFVGLLLLVPEVASAPRIASMLVVAGAALFIITVSKPTSGLLVIAGLLPLATPLSYLLGGSLGPAETAEFFLLAFLAASCIRLGLSPIEIRTSLAPAVVVSAAVVAAAAILGLAEEQLRTRMPAVFWRDVGRHLLQTYLLQPLDFQSLHVGMIWIEGLTLSLVVERLLRWQPRSSVAVCHMLVIGVTGAAVVTVNRIVEVFLRNGSSIAATASVLSTVRIGIHWTDINAIASFYALFIVPAVWLAWTLRRIWLWAASALLLNALWFAGSRTATTGAVIGVFFAALVSRRPSKRGLALGIATGLIVVILAITWSARRSSPAESAYRIRSEMARVAIDLASEHPGFGVGLGQFRRKSVALISPEALAMFPALAKGENAHNNFLQILAEQGWAGAASFIWLLLASAGGIARAIRSGHATPQLTGLVGGLVAFLVTCLAGHPLMMPQVVYFFLLVLGLVCGIAPPPAASSARWQRNIAIAFIAVIATSVPIRLANLSRFTNLDGVVLGASAPAGEIDDVEYRMAEAHSIWLVPASTSVVQMPLRLAAGSKGPCRVTISLDGGDGDIVEPETGAWLNVRYTLPAGSKRASRRFDVRTTSDCQLMVGRLVSH